MTQDLIGKDQLRSYCERAERLQEEVKALQDDKREVFKEAKGAGFDVPALKALIKLRGMDDSDRKAKEEMLDLYRHAVGCE